MGILTAILNTLIVLVCLFLICLILIQRGKGGGLAGAFGGVGGSSAFGTKAGDTFTKITMVTAAIWIVMSMLLVVITNRRNDSAWDTGAATSLTKELGSSSKKTNSATEDTIPRPTSADPAGVVDTSPLAAPAIPESTPFPPTPDTTPAPK